MQGQKILWSSQTDQWSTPQDFFNKLNEEFNFNLDPCADEYNHKCSKFFTAKEDGLKQNWGGAECSAILHMAGVLENGLKSLMKKVESRTLL